MGYFVKNFAVTTGSTAIGIPSGNSTDRPEDPVFGQLRFNTTISNMEFYDGTSWINLIKQGQNDITVDEFTGDGSTTVFTMTVQEDTEEDLLVFVGGIYQIPTTNYTVDGSYDITFTTAPPNTVPVHVVQGFNNTGS